jgi:hypothetical protein
MKKPLKKTLLPLLAGGCLLAAGFGCGVAAPPDRPPGGDRVELTLAAALVRAESNLLAVRCREFSERIGRENDRSTLLLKLPQLIARSGPERTDDLGAESRAALELATAGLFSGPNISSDEAERCRRGRVRQLLAEEVALTFFALMAAEEQLSLLESYRARLGDSTGFRRTELELTGLVNERKLELRTLCGLPPGSDLYLKRPDAIAVPELGPEEALVAALADRPEFSNCALSPPVLAAAVRRLEKRLPPATVNTAAARGFFCAALLLRLPRQLEIRRIEERPTPPELTALALGLGVAAGIELDREAVAARQRELVRAGEEERLSGDDFYGRLRLIQAREALTAAAIRFRTDLGIGCFDPPRTPAAVTEMPPEPVAAVELLAGIFGGPQSL